MSTYAPSTRASRGSNASAGGPAPARTPASGRRANEGFHHSNAVAESCAGRAPRSSPADRLDQLSDRLDLLIRDVRIGATSHRQHDTNVAEAEAIAAELRGVFRGTGPKPVNPPLWLGHGKAIW